MDKPHPKKFTEESPVICRKCDYSGVSEIDHPDLSLIQKLTSSIKKLISPHSRRRRPGTVSYETQRKLNKGMEFVCPSCHSPDIDFFEYDEV